MREPVVILTRQHDDVAPLRDVLESRGCRVIELPCIRTEALPDRAMLDAGLDALKRDDLLVVTSRAGVDAVMAGQREIPCGAAVIGPATAQRARNAGLRVVFEPSRPDAATFAREIPLPRGTLVLARSEIADQELPEMLRRRRARVRELVAYRTIVGASGDIAAVDAALRDGRATIGVASPSAVRALSAAIEGELLRQATIVAIGPRTAREVREHIGIEPVVALSPATEDLADVMSPRKQEVVR